VGCVGMSDPMRRSVDPSRGRAYTHTRCTSIRVNTPLPAKPLEGGVVAVVGHGVGGALASFAAPDVIHLIELINSTMAKKQPRL